MRYEITQTHVNSFRNNHYIYFEDFFTPDEWAQISVIQKDPAKPLETRRDMFEKDPLWKKLLKKRRFADVLRGLYFKPSVLVAFDQVLMQESTPIYPTEPTPIGEVSCFQKLVAGALIPIEEVTLHLMDAGGPIDYPLKKGSILFFDTRFEIPFGDLTTDPAHHSVLIGFGSMETTYVDNPKDPAGRFLKKYHKWTFGDTLSPDFNPLILRK
ncbi:MAG: hypothetical protein S4CHLAM102_14500 [Chlamydiia bacterium]|nr:hypothetical protein [Chlamydiia bacterium]